MGKAKKEDWKTLEWPTKRENLGYFAAFNDSEVDKIIAGLIPQVMEDKWFIYFSEGWLYFHRSWTGALIYALKLAGSPAGVKVVESWVNREPEQYTEQDIDYDRQFVDFLIRAFLLGQEAQFPIRKNDSETNPSGVYQHHMVGRTYPENIIDGSQNGFWSRLFGKWRRKPKKD